MNYDKKTISEEKHETDSQNWKNIAIQCVQQRKLDQAELCLSQMKNPTGARYVREGKEEGLLVGVGMLAVQLGMIDEAVTIFKEAERPDQVVWVLMQAGRWNDAVDVAMREDRTSLSAVYYRHARYLEQIETRTQATDEYKKCASGKKEIARMLYDRREYDQLESFTLNSQDPSMIRWWGQLCESQGEFARAYQAYQAADDTLNITRMQCRYGRIDEAVQLVKGKDNKAAAYHVALHCEETDLLEDAMELFAVAGTYKQAIRIALRFDQPDRVMTYAVHASSKVMLDAARYFEQRNEFSKAASLFQRSGYLSTAIELCIEHQLYETLETLSDDLPDNTDESTMVQCAEVLEAHERYDRAAQMYVRAKNSMQALRLCQKHLVELTDELSEKMSPKRGEMSREERRRILVAIADAAQSQGKFALASRKYTQAGDRLQAIKTLIRSGDTERVILYAQTARQKDIYVLAANYLQNQTSDLSEHIVNFYRKAKAYGSLATFYEEQCNVEVEENRNYEKALSALQHARRAMAESRSEDRNDKIALLDGRISVMSKFVEARRLVKEDPRQMILLCHELLEGEEGSRRHGGLDDRTVKTGDVYALLVEYYRSTHDNARAFQLLQQMKERGLDLQYFLDPGLVRGVCQALGEDPDPLLRSHIYEGKENDEKEEEEEEEGQIVDEDL